jgi:hypothetical protein
MGGMIYLKASIVNRYAPMCDWGAATRYFEIGDDLYATRHVDTYENGYALRYDRENWRDKCGWIACAKYDANKWLKWWGPNEQMSARDFEAVWSLSETAVNQPQLYIDGEPWPLLVAEHAREQKRKQKNRRLKK